MCKSRGKGEFERLVRSVMRGGRDDADALVSPPASDPCASASDPCASDDSVPPVPPATATARAPELSESELASAVAPACTAPAVVHMRSSGHGIGGGSGVGDGCGAESNVSGGLRGKRA